MNVKYLMSVAHKLAETWKDDKNDNKCLEETERLNNHALALCNGANGK